MALPDGTRKPCETHFRVWLQISRLFDDPAVPDLEKAARAISLSGIEPGDVAEDLDGVSWFLHAGAVETRPRKAAQRSMDWDMDAGLIVASFQKEYGIDITARGCSMHWWRFLDLLRGMGNDAPIMQAAQVRAMKLPEGNDKWSRERRDAIAEAKKRLAIPAKTASEKAAREKALWGD